MSRNPFDPAFEALPAGIPIFPLTGALLLPRGKLPLNIFEPRYLEMTRAALAAPDRLIGMIQPLPDETDAKAPALYRTGCAGRITEFAEITDGRYLITLSGVCRFDIADELPRERLFRSIVADWRRFRRDLEPEAGAIERTRLMAALKPFFAHHGIAADLALLEAMPDERLVTTLAMSCPFSPAEKQALLEAPGMGERARILTALVEMTALARQGSETADPSPALRH